MEAVRKEHTSLLLRDSQTVKELERRLCELEFLCERLEQLEHSPNAGAYQRDFSGRFRWPPSAQRRRREFATCCAR